MATIGQVWHYSDMEGKTFEEKNKDIEFVRTDEDHVSWECPKCNHENNQFIDEETFWCDKCKLEVMTCLNCLRAPLSGTSFSITMEEQEYSYVVGGWGTPIYKEATGRAWTCTNCGETKSEVYAD